MRVGVLTLEFALYEAMSLKDKRRVIKSLKDRIRNRFNVSVAEVGNADARRSATIAVAMVSNDAAYLHGCFDKIAEMAGKAGAATLLDYDKEIL